jgi:hypothetical protein
MLHNLIDAVPYKIHKILTDNGLQFAHHENHKHAFTHIFERVCNELGIEDRKTKARHLSTHGQVDCMNRTLMAYNVAKRTPWQFN